MRKILTLCVVIVVLPAVTTAAQATTIRTMSLGSTYTVRGQTGSLGGGSVPATGLVVVQSKWGRGAWHRLTTTQTDAHGAYRFSIKPAHRGLLAIRITPPDQRVQSFLLRVV